MSRPLSIRIPSSECLDLMTPEPGDFSRLNCTPSENEMLKDAYDAITRLNMWDFLATFKVDESTGFMFLDNPIMKKIDKELTYDGHSGGSYAYTMRTMENIAKNGWSHYVKTHIKARGLKRDPQSSPVAPIATNSQ